ncbi:hypothetical protein DSAG12_00634 [Promethearchaeum syntrophicum]|uniref:protein-L-isoaspartate(D-aspartate) O-methyltransferase n=1 Tax=Promethearchaeum syntrophicum TaxID=2594042 RepID=A0A5B9D7I6_9ARCH|nr:hypothetical protein [Candidatus Prometheoarchaeum syntrophicum]QEE14817.1 Protein-L-isoaspartate O-methyltransferase [Candidatus Prometheoarchaeum syntrophicum]
MNFQKLFQILLAKHIKMGYLRDIRIKEILGNLPLERLLTEDQLKRFILADSPVLFYYKDKKNIRTVSAPHMISMMTSMMELDSSDNVLILGSKGGIIEATISQAVEKVTIVEQHDEVASITEEAFIKLGIKNLWVQRQNPLFGLPKNGPYSKILITGAIPFIPYSLIDQLSINGILVAPLIMNHPNFQNIFQIIKQTKNLEIVNFGGVIFGPLYFTELPEINKNKDITIQKIINLIKDERKTPVLEKKEFFKEFSILPKIECHNLIFTETNEIYQNIALFKMEKEELVKECELQMSLFNPDSSPIQISFELFSPSTGEKQKINGILLKPQIPFLLKFNLKIPLKVGNFKVHFVCISLKRFRLAHTRAVFHVLKNKQLDEFEVSIEFNM